MDKKLSIILDRLDNRVSQGFGDFTAIKTSTSEKGQTLQICSQYDKSYLWYGYVVEDSLLPNNNQRNTSFIRTPKNWPKPDLKGVLQHIKGNTPDVYYVTDGQQVWSNGKMQRSLAEEIWFGRKHLLLNKRGAKAKLLREANRPNLTGIYTEGCICRCDSPSLQRIEQTLWLDPSRDDMPIEILSCGYKSDGKTVELKLLTKYIEYARLPNGRWYPAHWRMTSEVGERPAKSCREFHLQLFQGMKLDKSWFTNPRERLKNGEG